MPSLILSRADENDIDELLDPLHAALEGNDFLTVFFGHNTPSSRASAKTRIAAFMKTGGQNMWLKVVDNDTGKVISVAWWMIYPNWVSSEGLADAAAANITIDYLEGDDRYMGELILRDFLTRRARYTYGHPHILLALLFTDPVYQKCGAGTLQFQWGTTLADQLFLPLYIEATSLGHHLYAQNGANDLEKVRFEVKSPADPTKFWCNEYTMMRREPRKIAIEREKRGDAKN